MTSVVNVLFIQADEVIAIYTKFYGLESEKRQRIINAALKEFARNGYERASTNEIIKEAEISKGSLFNYFNSKKELYLFLFEYVDEIINKIYEEIDYEETDLFERTRQVGEIKFRIMKRYPQVFDFLKAAANEDSAEVRAEINKKEKSEVDKGMGRILDNIDWSKFRDDMDMEKIVNIIRWATMGFAEQQRNRLDSFENMDISLLSEWDEYFDILKRCFYKQDYI